MPPDFSQKTVAILCKRAGSTCSNPSCGSVTSGPSLDPTKSINIGEAAHIYGARPTSKRFRPDLTGPQIAEITNGIWLCGNCHNKIDADDKRYPAELLFEWRKCHEENVLSRLGKPSDLILNKVLEQQLDQIADASPLARQIIRERVPGWEFRLTAELLRAILTKPVRRWQDLQHGLYSKVGQKLTHSNFFEWISHQMKIATDIVGPFQKLISNELARSWGAPGVPGDFNEISHVCHLIGHAANQVVDWEEDVAFASAPADLEKLRNLLRGALGSQMLKLNAIPTLLNEAVDWAEANPNTPRVFEHTVIFELPDEFVHNVQQELDHLRRKLKC